MLKSFFQEELTEAGCDEAGRGSLAGPVVAAAVILPKDFFHPLLNDSKQLKEEERNILREYIIEHAEEYAIGCVDHSEIDRINILKASFKAMHIALDQFKTRPGLLLIDGNHFIPYKRIPHRCIVKGDALFACIAAASVLAKTFRDDLMLQLHKEYPYYGWDHNKAYATDYHRIAIEKHGLSPYHRRSFRCLPDQINLF